MYISEHGHCHQGPLLQMKCSLGLQAAAAHLQAAGEDAQAHSMGLRAAWSIPRLQLLSQSVPHSWLMPNPGQESRPGAEGEANLQAMQACSSCPVLNVVKLLLLAIHGSQLGWAMMGFCKYVPSSKTFALTQSGQVLSQSDLHILGASMNSSMPGMTIRAISHASYAAFELVHY